jgi:malate dehydrogenase (oxaloacetate-decarboxylating)
MQRADKFRESVLNFHSRKGGKIGIQTKNKVSNPKKLALAYTPGVAEVCKIIKKKPSSVFDYTLKRNSIAVVSDGSAVLGLGNLGAAPAIPVMEGKCAIFKEFAGIDAFPLCLRTQDPDEIIHIVEMLEPVFGGINLEDISAPRCFEIEKKLIKKLKIPVFHDDQHGTAIVVLAGMFNALKVVGKSKAKIKIVVNGAGAAGITILKLLHSAGFNDLILLDSVGVLNRRRKDLPPHKRKMLKYLSASSPDGRLEEALVGADVFIGVSEGGVLKKEYVPLMKRDPIVFALANPDPEILPSEARAAGVKVIATGRSDFPNQITSFYIFFILWKKES